MPDLTLVVCCTKRDPNLGCQVRRGDSRSERVLLHALCFGGLAAPPTLIRAQPGRARIERLGWTGRGQESGSAEGECGGNASDMLDREAHREKWLKISIKTTALYIYILCVLPYPVQYGYCAVDVVCAKTYSFIHVTDEKGKSEGKNEEKCI